MSNTIQEYEGKPSIWLYGDRAGNKVLIVPRLSRAKRDSCSHDWKWVAYSHRGEGKWRSGCSKCGALCR